MFTTIKLVSRHQNTQQYGAILPIELTNEAIRNYESYKEYYAIASGAEPPKTKASVRKKHTSFDTTITMPPPTAKGKRLKTSAKVDKPAKEKQPAKTGSVAAEGTSIILGVSDVLTYESDDEEISWKSKNDEDSDGMNAEGDEMDDEGANEKDDADELYRDVNINLKGRSIQMADVQTTQVIEDTHVTLTSVNPEATPIILTLQQTPVPLPANVPRSSLQDLPNFGSLFGFDHQLKALEINFSEFMQTNQFAKAISLIPDIVDKYLDHQMNEAMKVVVQLQLDRLRDEAQSENEDFLNKLDENIKKIIKEQVKEQVKAQVSKILPKIQKTVNEQLKAEVLTRSSNSSKISHTVADNLSELELKKILIEKMESNKSIHRSDEQKNLYKALVAYECEKLILDIYGNTVTLKRRQDDEDKYEEPFAGSNRGSKRRRAGKEPESTSAPKEKTSKTTGKSTEGSTSHHKSASESAPAEEPMHTTKDLEEPAHQEFDIGATDDQPVAEASHNLARKEDSRTLVNELMDTTFNLSAFVMNQLKVDTLTPKLSAGPTYELIKVSCKSLVALEFFLEEVYKATTDQLDWNNPEGQQYPHDMRKPLPLIPTSRGRRVIPFDHFINNVLEYLRGGVSSRKYTTSVTKTEAADYGHIKWIEDLVPLTIWSQVPDSHGKYALWGISHWGRKRQQFYGFAANRESARDVYSKRRIIPVTEL
nr:hypothetical protein [Tanacetum cinerariifolium]